jgi:hypothetical protein
MPTYAQLSVLAQWYHDHQVPMSSLEVYAGQQERMYDFLRSLPAENLLRTLPITSGADVLPGEATIVTRIPNLYRWLADHGFLNPLRLWEEPVAPSPQTVEVGVLSEVSMGARIDPEAQLYGGQLALSEGTSIRIDGQEVGVVTNWSARYDPPSIVEVEDLTGVFRETGTNAMAEMDIAIGGGARDSIIGRFIADSERERQPVLFHDARYLPRRLDYISVGRKTFLVDHIDEPPKKARPKTRWDIIREL